MDIWAADYLGGVKPFTELNYTQYIRNHIKPALGAIKLQTLKPHTIQGFCNSLAKPQGDKPGLSAKIIKCIHGILHKALGQAAAIGYIPVNPTDACELPRIERKEIQPLDDNAIGAFMKAVQGHPFEAVYLTALFTGLRRGELCGLTWDCVDLDRGTILINKQLQNVPGHPGEYRLVSSKNGKSRTIAAAPFVMDVLRRHRAWQNEMRHSYAVASLRAGDDIKTVQGNLGHHTAAFTLDVYGHVTEDMKKASAERMEKFIKDVSKL